MIWLLQYSLSPCNPCTLLGEAYLGSIKRVLEELTHVWASFFHSLSCGKEREIWVGFLVLVASLHGVYYGRCFRGPRRELVFRSPSQVIQDYKVFSEGKLKRLPLASSSGIKERRQRKKHEKETCLNKGRTRQTVDLVWFTQGSCFYSF